MCIYHRSGRASKPGLAELNLLAELVHTYFIRVDYTRGLPFFLQGNKFPQIIS